MIYEPWWDSHPGRLEAEFKALNRAGFPYEKDEQAFQNGRLKIKIVYNYKGQAVNLEVIFPLLFPYVRPHVIAKELNLARHQEPKDKSLCLIGRASENWKVDQSVADFINEQVPKVLEANEDVISDVNAELEEHQGEPVTEYYPYERGTILGVDSSWVISKDIEEGELVIGLESNSSGIVRGAVLTVKDSQGNIIAEAPEEIKSLYKDSVRGRWARSDKAIREFNPKSFLSKLFEQHPQISTPWWKRRSSHDFDLIGVLFPDEVKWREYKDSWVFTAQYRRKTKSRNWEYSQTFIKPTRLGKQDMTERIPELSFLSGKKVAIMGLGCLGSFSALEFARAGVQELRIIDGDDTEPGNSVRWPFGISVMGIPKANVIKNHISNHYPHTKVKSYVHTIGSSAGSDEKDLAILEEMIDGVDLIYDATAELGIHNLLSYLALQEKIPYILVSTTPGAWGGIVARFLPEKPCWYCFQKARTENLVPLPSQNPNGDIQPEGCASPTFTGSGFDVQQISLSAVRLAMATLSPGGTKDYPNVSWDALNINLRDELGNIIPVQTQVLEIPKDPNCSCAK